MFYLAAKEVGKIWTCSCWEKGNFIMINEFRYGQAWKNWPSPLSLSLYNTSNAWAYSKPLLTLIVEQSAFLQVHSFLGCSSPTKYPSTTFDATPPWKEIWRPLKNRPPHSIEIFNVLPPLEFFLFSYLMIVWITS